MAINLSKNKETILHAWKDVVDDKSETNWVLFSYEGLTDVLTVVSKGSNGVDEMKEELNSGKIMYAFCKVLDPKTSLNKYVLVNWQGESVPLLRKGVCANHIRDVSNVLKGTHFTLNARTEEDVDEDIIIEKVSKSTASTYSFEERLDLSKDGFQKIDSAYKKVEPKNEIDPIERDKFWAFEEAQEKQRQIEEMKKKRDELLRLEEERLRRETEEAKKRDQVLDSEKLTNQIFQKSPIIKPSPIISHVEKTKDSVEEIKELRKKEAQELISQRTTDVRAVFEKNTSAGQFNSSRYSSPPFNASGVTMGDSKTRSNGSETVKAATSDMKTVTHVENGSAQASMNSISPEAKDYRNEVYHGPSSDINMKAVALYDYQAADDTEISFDPDDIITNIEQIDSGWWHGLAPDGSSGLFPANYVQLIP